jgi:hypothetical protein
MALIRSIGIVATDRLLPASSSGPYPQPATFAFPALTSAQSVEARILAFVVRGIPFPPVNAYKCRSATRKPTSALDQRVPGVDFVARVFDVADMM